MESLDGHIASTSNIGAKISTKVINHRYFCEWNLMISAKSKTQSTAIKEYKKNDGNIKIQLKFNRNIIEIQQKPLKTIEKWETGCIFHYQSYIYLVNSPTLSTVRLTGEFLENWFIAEVVRISDHAHSRGFVIPYK